MRSASKLGFALGLACLVVAQVQAQAAPAFDGARISEITGLQGKWNPQGDVFKVTLPRTDVSVTVDGHALSPFQGLTTWAGFTTGKGKDLMVMGDLVLFPDEVNPVMSALFDNGLDVTALHNHFFYDEPKVFFMHVSGEGTVDALAKGVRAAMDQVHGIRARRSAPATSFGNDSLPAANSVSAAPIEALLGKGESKDGMVKVTVGLTAKMSCGCNAGKDLGVNTWAAFAGSDSSAAVDGDFAVHENELQPVLRSLRGSGINIVAIHSHMTGEVPRTLFLHYWGRGPAVELAQAIKKALDVQTQNQKPKQPKKKEK
ncbi:MAG TPA: DUF1259 domain-containing protein [Bdellovibrionota bacterium]|nr:DUF1259 domain-containing protein [Bdellovibrionota bacterium]